VNAPDAIPDRTRDSTVAIISGIEAARANGLQKPFDVAISVRVALEDAGYRIVRAPKRAKATGEAPPIHSDPYCRNLTGYHGRLCSNCDDRRQAAANASVEE
jgi:hypothetical protein